MKRLHVLGIAAVVPLVASTAAAQQREMQREEMEQMQRQEMEREAQQAEEQELFREEMRSEMESQRQLRHQQMMMAQENRSLAGFGPLSDWGVALTLGGGVYNFLDDDTRDFVDTGGLWELRLILGTERTVGFEVAYIGGAQNIDAVGLGGDPIWLSTAVEGGIRVHLWNSNFAPYLFGGVAYRRFDLVNEDRNVSNVSTEEQLVELPAGVGFSIKAGRFIFDTRGTIRPVASDEGLFDGPDNTSLNSWEWSAKVGANL